MSGRECSDNASDGERVDDAVDPRVQIELERLNTATDDINKLEVDLDDARATFRKLLCESQITINTMAKKLGSCIEKSQPYYDSRFKAKEALREAQKAAVRFERANSQHAAAKEMVYLAEEGLRMEGRSFDHAWQEMLNHATERVNESEHERALSEAEHRHMTGLYHNAEHNVQRLQSELKRSIAKSRPFYEMKAQFNQVLEKQKTRVSELERSVTEAKMTYAEALRNLEKISDEIHRTRQYDGSSEKPNTEKDNPTTSSSDSSVTGSPDSTDYTSDEYLQLPDKMSPNNSCPIPTKIEREPSTEYLGLTTINMSSTEPRKYIKRENRPRNVSTCTSSSSTPSTQKNSQKKVEFSSEKKIDEEKEEECHRGQNGEEWTEISLNNSPDEIYYNNDVYSDEEDHQIPYKPLPSELSPDSGTASIISGHRQQPIGERNKRLVNQQSLPNDWEGDGDGKEGTNSGGDLLEKNPSGRNRGKLDSSLANWISRSSAANSGQPNCSSSSNSSRRQSLDVLWSVGPGERVKELLNHGMMILNISSLTERRSSEPRLVEKDERVHKDDKVELKGKKVPSPLEKTMSYLNADEETSDSESLASVEMLSEDQISSLMMEPDINQVCQEVLGTPLVEVCPLLQELQQQH
ncbi:uncharacterized protein LOC107040303 isoform X2 [Diachasma alloeum]|uniref:uncharacterized protein LOC107040303 isoform X2 n=1 Tax=Diachasma alloeum TaxID=454923 RepID=UPI00073831DB|nr:uncharacterized protein LOC107040303 isoform X2 [Diachasma alloeum]